MTRRLDDSLTSMMATVVAAGLTLLLTTSLVFPCDALPATWSSSTVGADVSESAGLHCDFEDQQCRWQWSRFVRRSAAEINATIYSAPDPAMISGPLDDADGRPTGT